jgi:hypothetical protein
MDPAGIPALADASNFTRQPEPQRRSPAMPACVSSTLRDAPHLVSAALDGALP